MLRFAFVALLCASALAHSHSGDGGHHKHGVHHGHHGGHQKGHHMKHGHNHHKPAEQTIDWTVNRGIELNKVDGKVLKATFDSWKEAFGKTYSGPEEEAAHFMQFVDNWHKVIDFNEHANETYEMGLNQFADLSPDQFRTYIHGGSGSCLRGHVRKVWKEVETGADDTPIKANPASVDWTTKGVVTPVKNQGQCGSCWAFSTTGSLECRTAIKTGKLVSLSEQQLVDCSRAEGNQGCNGGLMDDGFKYIKKEGGLCTEQAYPYTAKDGTCKAATCGKKFDPITGYKDVARSSAPSLETAAAAGCVSVAIEADQSAFQFYKTGILSGRCGSRLDHGVLVVGYGSEGGKKYWKVKNSWGASWGEQGYIRICKECGKDFGRGECGILEQPSYPIV